MGNCEHYHNTTRYDLQAPPLLAIVSPMLNVFRDRPLVYDSGRCGQEKSIKFSPLFV